MKKISSASTGFYKKGFPALWFGFLGVSLFGALVQSGLRTGGVFLVVPCVMGLFGYVLMRRFVWDLADEVYDAGDCLIVKNRGREYRLPFTDIMNVSSSIAVNPPRITLRLTPQAASGSLGSEVVFSPVKKFSLNPFAKNEVAEDLMVRVDQARSKRGV